MNPCEGSHSVGAKFLDGATPTTLPRSSTNAPPELPGCTGTLIWKKRGSSLAPDNDAISRLASLGANPCKPTLGKPTVATVLPNRARMFGNQVDSILRA